MPTINRGRPNAVYMRISTNDQNLDGQRRELTKWLADKGIAPESVCWYEDTFSGKRLDRVALTRLQEDITRGHVQTVIVWKLDRLSRKMLDAMNMVAAWVEKGVRLVSTTQAVDLSGPLGRMVAAILFSIAEIETGYRLERQKAGIAVAREKGKYKGRVKGSLKASPMRAMELYRKGNRLKEIALSLGVSPFTVSRYIAQLKKDEAELKTALEAA